MGAGLTESERMELDGAQRYRCPCRRDSSLPYIASENQAKAFGAAGAQAVKVVGEADLDRARRVAQFFEKFEKVHPAQSPCGRWDALGKALWGAEKDLWNSLDRNAPSLPFHADPEFARGPMSEFLSKARNPVDVIKELLTDGRAVYQVLFAVSGCAAPLVRGPMEMTFVNLPLKGPTYPEGAVGVRIDEIDGRGPRADLSRAQPSSGPGNMTGSARTRAIASNRPSPRDAGLVDEGRARGAMLVEQGLRALSLPDEEPPSQYETMAHVLVGNSFGVTEPPEQKEQRVRYGARLWNQDAVDRIAATEAAGPLGARTGQRGSPRSRALADLENSRRGNRFTAGKKWMSELPTFAPGMTARPTCLSDGRQTHFSAEFLLRAVKKGEQITFFAYSFDHPRVMEDIVGAVECGVKVDLYATAGDLLGESNSRRGIPLTAGAMDRSARAPEPGRFRVFAQRGCDLRGAYARCDWGAGNAALGASRAKALYAPPYLIPGSSNWSVSSEGNRGISCVLELGDEAGLKYVEGFLDELTRGAHEVTSREMRNSPMSKNGRGKSQFARG